MDMIISTYPFKVTWYNKLNLQTIGELNIHIDQLKLYHEGNVQARYKEMQN
jgi:hypothetical protein